MPTQRCILLIELHDGADTSISSTYVERVPVTVSGPLKHELGSLLAYERIRDDTLINILKTVVILDSGKFICSVRYCL